MPKIARAHHFVPQFMLANFTPEGRRSDLLWVTDLKSDKQWRSTPENTGHRRDFYRVDGAEVPPEAVEQMLGAIEDKVAPVVRRVVKSQTLPEQRDDYETLIHFIALLATRVPAIRETIDDFFNRIGQRILEMSVATPERWESLQRQMRDQGYSSGEQLSYDAARRIMEDRSVRFSVNRNWQLGMMFQSAGVVFPTLLERTWCVLVSPSGNLICSDRPVTIVFTRPAPLYLSPGFGLNHTEVTIPLSRHVLLRGVWDKQPAYAVSMNRNWVALYNTLRTIQADRFLFSAAQDFPWMDNGRSVRNEIQGLQEFFRSQTDPGSGVDEQ